MKWPLFENHYARVDSIFSSYCQTVFQKSTYTYTRIFWECLFTDTLVIVVYYYLKNKMKIPCLSDGWKMACFFYPLNPHWRICFLMIETDRQTDLCWLPPVHTLTGGLNPQPRYVPWPGIEPKTFFFLWSVGQLPNQLSHLARAFLSLLIVCGRTMENNF